MHQETAWIVMNASQPNDRFKIPRWHTDGCYFPPHNGEQFKVVVTLAGPSTLFYNLPDEQRKDFNSLNNARVETNNMLKNIKPVSPVFGQGAAFIAGSQTRAAVHSEPHINSDRLFLAIAPCSRAQLDGRLEFDKKMKSDPAFLEKLEEAKKLAFSLPPEPVVNESISKPVENGTKLHSGKVQLWSFNKPNPSSVEEKEEKDEIRSNQVYRR